MLGDADFTSTWLPMLGMGRDVPDGVTRMDKNGQLEIDWNFKTSREYLKGAENTMREIAHELQAKFVVNPTFFANRLTTVHPLGGCPMDATSAKGWSMRMVRCLTTPVYTS